MDKESFSNTAIERPAQIAVPEAAPRRGFAIALMIVSSTALSFGGLLLRNIEQADAWQINLYRSLALIIAVSLILTFQYRSEAVSRIRKVGRSGVWASLLIAAAGIAFIQAISHTTVANTMFTLSAIPFITAALARVFLKEALKPVTLYAMIAAAVGVTVMVADGFGVGSGYGNIMALATACGFAGFTVIVRSNRHIDMLPTLMISGVMIVTVAFIMRFDDLGISFKDLMLCILWGGVLSGFGNGMFIVASRHLVAAELTLFMLLEFALAPLWVWLFIAEAPTYWALAGGGLVITSVTVRALIELRGSGPRLRRGRPSPL